MPEDGDRARVTAIAQRLLPDDVRDRWLAMLRPAVRLSRMVGDEPWVARFGGLPGLPANQPWPEWPGHGPLSFIGEIDCAALSRFELSFTLPTSGRLLFFYFDSVLDNGRSTVHSSDPESKAGAQTLYVPAGVPTEVRSAPPGLSPYLQVLRGGRQILTAPDCEHPTLLAEFLRPGEDYLGFLDNHPVCQDKFLEAIEEGQVGRGNQIGGHAAPVQHPVEYEVANAALGNIPWDDPRLPVEAARWQLLLQVDTDPELGTQWGDRGALYWLARPSDLAAGDLTHIRFTWQCC